MPSLLSLVSRGTLAVVGGGGLALSAGEYAESDSKAVRSFRFWKGMVPVYLHYKLVERRVQNETDAEKISAAYRPLNERYSPKVEQLALDLKGFYYKLAQVLSTRDDFLPEQYKKWTKELQDQSPSVLPSEEVQKIVENSLGESVDTLFTQWDDEPIGAASVGQVHRAVLNDGKMTEVAVKVQYPGIERKFRNDIETVELFCKYLMPQNIAFFREIKKQFATEFDMDGEAENLREVHDNLHRAGWDRLVEVPYPIKSSKEVLVMTYLSGRKLVDGLREHFAKLAAKRGMTLDEMEDEQRRKMENGDQIRRVDIRDAKNISRGVGWLLSTRNLCVNSLLFVLNYTVRPVTGKWEYWSNGDFINLGELMDTLVRVHGHEIFTDGSFNGDPHPGNILLMDDGRLGLIDYGQVKRMAIEDRIVYAKLMIAINRNDRAEVVRLARDESGYHTKYSRDEITYKALSFFHCRDTDDILEGKNVSEFMEWLEKSDPVQTINDEFVMVGRVSLLLRGMANAFGMKVKISDYWREEASKFLKSQGIDY